MFTSSSVTNSRELNDSAVQINPVLKIVLVLFALMIMGYGLLAADMGRTLGLSLFSDERTSEIIDYFNLTREDRTNLDTNRLAEEVGLWNRIQSAVVSEEYSYGDGSFYETYIDYITLPKLNQAFLTFHTSLAAFCMLLAPFQFWPPARRKYPNAHRKVGWVYASTVLLSMIGSAGFLITTPIEKVYAGWTFFVALSSACFFTTVSMILAVYFARKKDLAKHQAFMALNFGFLLTAPLLRVDWIIVGAFFPGYTQMEIHHFAQNLLGAQSLLTAYFVLCVVRSMQKNRETAVALPSWCEKVKNSLPIVAALASFPLIYGSMHALDYYFSIGWGLGQSLAIPESLLLLEQQVASESNLAKLAIGSVILAVPFGLLSLSSFSRTDYLQRLVGVRSKLVAVPVLALASCFSLMYGARLGLPTYEVSGAGTFFLTYGIVGAILVASQLYALAKRANEVLNELALFSLGLMLVPPLVFLGLRQVESSSLSLHDYYNAAIAEVGTLLVFAFIYVAFSEATRRKYAA